MYDLSDSPQHTPVGKITIGTYCSFCKKWTVHESIKTIRELNQDNKSMKTICLKCKGINNGRSL